jgi:hypothetical protein
MLKGHDDRAFARLFIQPEASSEKPEAVKATGNVWHL